LKHKETKTTVTYFIIHISYFLFKNATFSTLITPTNITTATTYYIKITGANGCTNTSSFDVLAFRTIPTATIAPFPGCIGSSASLDASGSTSGASFVWTTADGMVTAGSTTATPTITTTGTYEVNVTVNGCSSTAAVTVACTLPVKLLYFKGEIVGQTNMLNWKTATEVNSEVFLIERSDDGMYFKTIGTQTAAGNSNIVLNYNFIDKTPNIKHYYRLRLVDKDGSFEYSNVVVLERQTEVSTITSLYPNPTSHSISLSYTTTTDGLTGISIVDALGRQVFYTKETKVAGLYTVNIDLADLPSGVYFLTLEEGSRRIVRKIVKE